MAKQMDHDMQMSPHGSGQTYPFDEWYNGRTWRIYQGEDFFIKVDSMRSRLQNEWNSRELPEEDDDFIVHFCKTTVMLDEGKVCIEFQAMQFAPDSDHGRTRLAYRRNLEEQAAKRRDR